MSDPTTREDIEQLLRAKYEAGCLDAGLFSTGLAFVVMDNVDGNLQFTWFDDATDFEQVLQAA